MTIEPLELMNEDISNNNGTPRSPEDSFAENDAPSRRLLPTDTGSSWYHKLRAYLSSSNGAELCFCSLLMASGFILEYAAIEPRQRTIPYLQLESTNDVIVNQVFNEEFVGDIVSGT